MILYNVTVGIDKEIEAEWVDWIKREQVPSIMATKLFVDFRFYKVLTHEDETTVSYCIQYFTPDILSFNQYLEKFAATHVEQHRSRFTDRHVVFNTLLEQV